MIVFFLIKVFWKKLISKKDNQEEILNKPEFEGLWNKKLKSYDSQDLYNEKVKYPAAFKSKAEKVMIWSLNDH